MAIHGMHSHKISNNKRVNKHLLHQIKCVRYTRRFVFTFHICWCTLCTSQMNGFYSICSSVVKWQLTLTFKSKFKFTNIHMRRIYLYQSLSYYYTCFRLMCSRHIYNIHWIYLLLLYSHHNIDGIERTNIVKTSMRIRQYGVCMPCNIAHFFWWKFWDWQSFCEKIKRDIHEEANTHIHTLCSLCVEQYDVLFLLPFSHIHKFVCTLSAICKSSILYLTWVSIWANFTFQSTDIWYTGRRRDTSVFVISVICYLISILRQMSSKQTNTYTKWLYELVRAEPSRHFCFTHLNHPKRYTWNAKREIKLLRHTDTNKTCMHACMHNSIALKIHKMVVHRCDLDWPKIGLDNAVILLSSVKVVFMSDDSDNMLWCIRNIHLQNFSFQKDTESALKKSEQHFYSRPCIHSYSNSIFCLILLFVIFNAWFWMMIILAMTKLSNGIVLSC